MSFLSGIFRHKGTKRDSDHMEGLEEEIKRAKIEDYTYETSDDEEPAMPARLDWRDHESYSDWTITVYNDLGQESYRVHRSILVLQSEFFHNLYANERDQVEGESHLKLPPQAAAFFPSFLDYVYSQTLNLTSQNAASFHYLGNFFGMKHLRWQARKFWETDLSFDTIGLYYENALALHDIKLLDAVKQACCKVDILMRLEPDSKILDISDPRLLLHLLECMGPAHSEHLSNLVSAYCSRHQVHPDLFEDLTREEVLPTIAFKAVVPLLEWEMYLYGLPNQMTNLQDRCIDALVKNWQGIDASSKEFLDVLRRHSPNFLAELFRRSIAAAQALAATTKPGQQATESPEAAAEAEARDEGNVLFRCETGVTNESRTLDHVTETLATNAGENVISPGGGNDDSATAVEEDNWMPEAPLN